MIMSANYKALAFLSFWALSTSSIFGQLRINEAVSSNSESFYDEQGDTPDWIELYNAGSEAISLANIFVSDSPSNLFLGPLPDSLVQPGAFVLVLASDKTLPDSVLSYIHVPFKLSASGESIYLANGDGSLRDSLVLPALESDISYGLDPESLQPRRFNVATPGAANSNSEFQERLEAPTLNILGGLFHSAQTILQTNDGLSGMLYYTLDGSEPTTESSPWSDDAGLVVSETTVLKIKAINEGFAVSPTLTQTYFFNIEHTLPIVSLVADPDLLFDRNEGIYINYEEETEIPAHLEVFEPEGPLAFAIPVGARIYGSYSRRFDQKSFAFYLRNSYGASELKYRLFEEKSISNFQSFILRNAGNDFSNAHIRDAVMSSIVQDHVDLDYQAYQPAVLYINGQYWGVQNFREKISEHFIASNRGVDKDAIDLLEAGEIPSVKHGSVDDWMSLLSLLETKDASLEEDYKEITASIDLENYIDYMVTEIFYANTDWPAINSKFWKEQGPNGKWRWVLYDLEHGFNLYSGNGDFNLDMMEHVLQTNPDRLKYGNPLWSTQLFRSLMENDDFKRRFITRMAGMMNTTFNTERMIGVIDSISALVEPEMFDHEVRWGLSWHPFASQVEDMRHFARNRHEYMVEHMQTHLGLTRQNSITVNVSDPDHGHVQVHRSLPDAYPYKGYYFSEYDIQVTAIPKPGYTFVGWTGSVSSTDSSIWISVRKSVTANFEPTHEASGSLVINELMYNSANDTDSGDWVELYNGSASEADLSGWTIKDNDDTHLYTFAEETRIAPNDFMVIVQDTALFFSQHPKSIPFIGPFDFGLSGSSDAIRLYDAEGRLFDIISYTDESPWDAAADGTGYSLELISPDLDNELPESWKASTQLLGSPGKANTVLVANETDDSEVDATLPKGIRLEQNYPNPFNPNTTLSFYLDEATEIDLMVYSITGQKVATLASGVYAKGWHDVSWNATGMASGVYVYLLESDHFRLNKKMMLIK